MEDTTAAIEAAKKNLQLKEVLILNLLIDVSDELSEAPGTTDARIAMRNSCTEHKILEASDEKRTVRFKYQCGLRLADHEVASRSTPNDLEPKDVLLEIKATYAVDYTIKDDLSNEELQSFGLVNVGYHVWPFWRELVQSSCNRIGISPIPLPFYKTPKIKKE
ncbi:hypothetical protein [Pseudomonas indica]|jgi:hypothetical protein|uniref:hypothetical protein n=1 Tax=Pseudomonas indica TaxID=137658 RepID=UPI003FD0366E